MLLLMVEDVLEVWRVHEEINSFLLAHIPGDGFNAVMPLGRGERCPRRTVARVFAHLYLVRVANLGGDVPDVLPRLDPHVTPSREELQRAFRASGAAVERRIEKALSTRERIEDRPGIVLLDYLIEHEAHHRGQIILALKQSGLGMYEHSKIRISARWFIPSCSSR
jgi:uncharacterized damage-inducible protein DinB